MALLTPEMFTGWGSERVKPVTFPTISVLLAHTKRRQEDGEGGAGRGGGGGGGEGAELGGGRD